MNLKAKESVLKETLTKGNMTRRQLLKWMTAMGVSAVASNSLIGSFGKSAFAATPKPGGRFRVALSSISIKDSMDPARFSYMGDYCRGTTFYNSLVRLDTNAQAQPELASSFEPNADATEWTFNLRKDVTFHDGKTLDANDVVYSLMRHKDPKVGSNAKALADMIESVKADGKHRVIVKLAQSNGDLPILLGTFHFMIIKDGVTDFSTAVGTGPYKVKEFKPGIRSLGVRNENYFLDGPYMEEQELFGIADPSARLNAVYSGEVHLSDDVAMSSVQDIQAKEGIEIFSTPAPRFTHLVMMTDRPPFNNPDLRLAIKHLVDRERLLKTVIKNFGQLGNDHPFAPSDPYYNSDLPQRGLDRDKAKYHLKKAKMENAKLELHVSEAAFNSAELGMLLQNQAARVGLTIDLKREPTDGYWSNIWRKRSFHAAEWNARSTNDLLLSIGFKSDAKWNESGYKNAQMDKLIDQARAETDFNTRKEIYGKLQAIMYEDGCNVIPCFTNYVNVKRTNVKGLIPRKTGGLGGYNYADSVWLDS